MLEHLADSAQKAEAADSNRVRVRDVIVERRLWIATDLPRSMADLCLIGGALGGTVLIAGGERRPSGRVVDTVGRG